MTKPENSDRDPKTGRFRPGNQIAKGMRNPGVAKANSLRAAALSEMTPNKIKLLMNAMLKRAMKGNVAAADLVLRYSLGPAINFDLVERVRDVERASGIDTRDSYPLRLETPMLEFEIGEDGEIVTVRGKPRPIRDRDVIDEEQSSDG